jgi:hypothetical protein
MTAPVMFNRRLGKSEFDIWLRLLEKETEIGYLDRITASHFLKHQDTIAFVSSVEDKIIGGTVIHRDRTRLGMVLASASVREEYRENGAFSVIKSSLPFFKTVAIRDIDAIVPYERTIERIGFPGSLELDYWTKDVLSKIGFEENSRLYYSAIDLEEIRTNPSDILYDKTTDIEKAKNLIWDQGKSAGLTNSHIWTQFDFAIDQNTLRSISIEDELQLVFSYNIIGQTGIVNFVITGDEYFERGLASRAISEIVRKSDVNQLILPLSGEGQKELVQSIADELRGSLKNRTSTLMRKYL